MTYVDEIKLRIYEAFDDGELTVDEKTVLLENIDDKLFPVYNERELQAIHEAAMKTSMFDKFANKVAVGGVKNSRDEGLGGSAYNKASNITNKIYTNTEMDRLGGKRISDDDLLQDSLKLQQSVVDDMTTASKEGIKVGIAMTVATAAVIAGIYAIAKKRSISIKNKKMVNNISSDKWDDVMVISRYLEEMQKEIVDIKQKLGDYTTELNNKKNLANPLTSRKEIKEIEQEIKRQNRRLKHILKELDKTRTKFCNLLTEKNGYAGADELKKDAMKLFDRLDEYATKLDDSYEKL